MGEALLHGCGCDSLSLSRQILDEQMDSGHVLIAGHVVVIRHLFDKMFAPACWPLVPSGRVHCPLYLDGVH